MATARRLTTPLKARREAIIESGGEAINLCYQCSLCTQVCPWNLVRDFLTHKIIHQLQLGLFDFESEEVWICATCNACVRRCPRGVKIIDVMRALRSTLVELDISYAPEPLRITIANLSSVGNPLGEAPEKRADWAKELGIKAFTEDTELLYFPCCIPCYDPKATGIARATASILKKLGVNFGILGVDESCCGEAIRKAGAESVFQDLAESNIATFAKNGVKESVVSSPHCYNTFKNEYPELGGNFETVHFTQYLSQAIKEERLKFTKQVTKRVTYHDPCYLGRHNNIYDEPREVLKSIPGLELVEMPNSRENSLCCGGGGGRIWMETKKEERLADLRLKQALDVGAEILATACPYCLINLKDSVVSMDKEKVIEVKDISEIVQEAI